jgi:hypothetical protein
VPAESARLTRRLRSRDWWFLGLVAAALAVGVAAAAIYVAGSKENVKPGCIATIRAGIMGGQTYSVCGKKALAFCRFHAGDTKGLTAECSRVVALFGR